MKLRNFALAILVIFNINLCNGARALAQAHGGRQNEAALNKSLDDGSGCLDYQLDVLALGDYDHRIYWKISDCVRVFVTNNPFIFKYSLTFNEQLIKEDDPLSAFAGQLGLSKSQVSGNPSTAAATGTHASETKDVESANAQEIGKARVNANNKLNSVQAPSELHSMVDAYSYKVESLPSNAEIEDATKKSKEQIEKSKANTNQKQVAKDSVDEIKKSAAPVIPPSPDEIDQAASLRDSGQVLGQMVSVLKAEYEQYRHSVEGSLPTLTDPGTHFDTVQSTTKSLRDAAEAQIQCLTRAQFDLQNTMVIGCASNAMLPSSNGSSGCDNPANHTLFCELLAIAHLAPQLHDKLQPTLPSGDKATNAMDEVHTAARDAAYYACVYQAFENADIGSIQTGLLAPLQSVLNDGLSFGYLYPNAAYKREGPFADPTSVVMTLKRDKVFPFTSADGQLNVLSSTELTFSCTGDPDDLLANGDAYTSLDDFFSDKQPKAGSLQVTGKTGTQSQVPTNLYLRNPNKPVQTSKQITPVANPSKKITTGTTGDNPSQQSATTPTNDDTVLVQPWLFGKPRLVLSGGLSTAFLTKQEFQRSMSITSTGASTTVIGYKTNSAIRATPMLYGQVLLPWLNLGTGRHSSEAWYATFGVTASSDNKSTDPEFLLGLSRSFAQQRFFITGGAYIGERQKLDQGLAVGQTIPSTFTTDIPVTKSYRAGFAIGISYRFTSTKTPQDNPAQANGQSKKGSS